jgi:hypothetical protein
MDTLRTEIQGLTVAKQVFEHDRSAYVAQRPVRANPGRPPSRRSRRSRRSSQRCQPTSPDADTAGVERSTRVPSGESSSRQTQRATPRQCTKGARGAAQGFEGSGRTARDAEGAARPHARRARSGYSTTRWIRSARLSRSSTRWRTMGTLAHPPGGRDLDIGWTTGQARIVSAEPIPCRPGRSIARRSRCSSARSMVRRGAGRVAARRPSSKFIRTPNARRC